MNIAFRLNERRKIVYWGNYFINLWILLLNWESWLLLRA
jgi:hypothetical protein